MKSRKAEGFNTVIGLATAIATVVVILIVVFIISAQGRTEIANTAGTNSTEYNMTVDTVEGISIFPSFLPIIILAGIGAAAIGIIKVMKK